jgi:uncharacterized protein (TIGR03083 family)
MPLDRDVLLAALAREAEAFCAVLETADLSAPVQHCPGWDLVELTAHVAGVHRWARNAVAGGELRRDPTPELPDRAAVVEWYRSSADALLHALRTAPDDRPCPSFLTPDSTAAFWLRRQVHELSVHRYDAQLTAGLSPQLDSTVAADGISEVLEVFLPRMRQRGLLGDLPGTIVLQQVDGPGSWTLGDGTPSATVHASAQDLLLALWKRRPLDGHIDGDAATARAVLACALTP